MPRRPPTEEALARVVDRNIFALLERRHREEKNRRLPDRIASRISAFAGSIKFVVLHLILFGGWIAVNVFDLGIPQFDKSLVILAMFASVEAIFISTFVLITQNRMAEVADKRADLDLQISLLAEHEVTQLIHLMRKVAARMGIEESNNSELDELSKDVAPEKVLDRIEQNTAKHSEAKNSAST